MPVKAPQNLLVARDRKTGEIVSATVAAQPSASIALRWLLLGLKVRTEPRKAVMEEIDRKMEDQ